jgi:hypothetical protein
VYENDIGVMSVTATDFNGNANTIRYSIHGGDDGALFAIDAVLGILSFKANPDFETPLDVDTNNIYKVEVNASDGINASLQLITVTLLDVFDLNIKVGIKRLEFFWTKVDGAVGYRLMEDRDGASGFIEIGAPISATNILLEGIAVHNLSWNLKTALSGTYHAINHTKYAHRYLAICLSL